ncbi:tRNA (adenosine(37)-N6)-threonylcarbamoyltransferase complex transferase subunit TsaD [Candidatus Gottesmanbacteria bacterium]|nr:tRNA (adenosine(37)-N6)-threonylcarbamoyltransferase complex transferase subunit TsaD [Candidatus Gottesmanbacteria bacterium]
MRILAIETSCDETAAAVVENGTKILSSVLASSSDIHQKTGGVVPEEAAREQVKCIIPVIDEAIKNSKLKIKNLNAIAVTVGPGLIGSLLVGVETAKTLAFTWHKPIIPINHLVAHIYANWLTTYDQPPTTNHQLPEFPALCLVVSGGHTDLVLMKNHGKFQYLGGTRDDAAGECFDKTARLLGLAPYYGGPAIAAAAKQYNTVILGRIRQLAETTPESDLSRAKSRDSGQVLRPRAQDRGAQDRGARMTKKNINISLPRPMISSNDLEMSFSGLKTAVVREVEKLKTIKQFNNETINYLAYEIQEAITDVLVAKIIKAAKIYQPKSILLAGGVSANQRLREKMALEIRNFLSTEALAKVEKLKINLFVPPSKLCTDNAAYIASCAYFNYHPAAWQKITADPGLSIV